MCKRFAFVAGLLLALAGAASADPVVLRAPSELSLDIEGNFFFFVGDGFTARQDPGSTLGVFFGGGFTGCDPCHAGETYDPSYTTTNAFMGNGTATVGGTTYSNVAFFGDIDFDATPQPFPDTDADTPRVQTPFTFTGALRGFVDSQLAFSVGLTGVGLTDRFYDNNHDGRFFAGERRLSFIFTDPKNATLE